ncbi:MAG: gliding motility-associated C-terminal domain-containing protein [Bacteroidetes bacterium]|nr:gliding motility-associated C-terminal domain-containing protein [Bacteroidota bacterium]
MATGVNLNGRILTTTGALTTNASTISIPPSIGITAAAINQTVCVGSPVVFAVSSTGGTSFQWRKGLVNIVNGGAISGATTGTLTINPVALSDAATNYNLVITGGCAGNFTTQNISLVVNNSATITTAINNQTVCAGSAASFTVSVPSGGVTYQWRKGTLNLINGGNISGANSASLIISPVAGIDASNNYNIVITGSCSLNYTSANVSLVVNNSQTITTAINNQTVCPGNSASFQATTSVSGLFYQWRIGSVNLNNGGNISGATSATLVINPATNPDASNLYNVLISGSCVNSYTSPNTSLVMSTPATITAVGNNQTVCAGSPATLSISTAGIGLSFQWRNASTNLINGGNISGANSQTLNFNPTNTTDASANYNVIIGDACGINYTTTNISLVVNSTADPIINSSFSVCTGKPIDLTSQTIVSATYNWSGPNAFTSSLQNPSIQTAAALNAGTYSLAITSNNCASKTSTVLVAVNTCKDSDFFIPEGFSPNGDGINDNFFIRGINNFPENSFVVFNRWGEKIFEANPYTNTWNGKTTMGTRLGGDQLPVGTYFYVLDLNDGSEVFKGTIYLNK